jgi:hypothetical protein
VGVQRTAAQGMTAFDDPSDVSSVPNVEDAFEKLIQDDDETIKNVMQKIWTELKHKHR